MDTLTIPYPMRPLPAVPSSDRMGSMPLHSPTRQVWVKTHTQRRVPVNVRSGGQNLGVGFTRNQEMYRALVERPQAYDEWHLDMLLEQRQARAVNGLLNYDCHRCKSTVLLTQDAERCTDCNGML